MNDKASGPVLLFLFLVVLNLSVIPLLNIFMHIQFYTFEFTVNHSTRSVKPETPFVVFLPIFNIFDCQILTRKIVLLKFE